MYALITKSENYLPTMVNMNSNSFPDFVQSGYEILKEGTKREIEKEYDELIVEFASNMD